MRRITLTLAVLSGSLLFSLPLTNACGDKALRIGRGARFQRSTHPASILIYVPSGTPETAATQAPRLQTFLKKAGHKPRIVQGTDGLSEALGSGQYDLVLTPLAEVASLQNQIDASPSKPLVVPIAMKATRAEVAAARRQYRWLVRNPNDGDEYLEAIEVAMRSRA